MALTYFSIAAHVGLTALPEEPWSFPASWARSKDSEYLMVNIEKDFPRLFRQAQASFGYEVLWLCLGEQGLGGLYIIPT